MHARREKDGAVVVTLPSAEARLLLELPSRLRDVLEDPDLSDRAVRRLFPPAYEDPERDAEYRRLVGDELLRRKLEGVDAFERTLRDRKAHLGRVRLRIRPQEYELWLGFVNDMRLFLGAELGIQDDGWSSDFDPWHPHAQDLALLHYLSWLEETLLRA